MAHKEDCAAAARNIVHFPNAFFLEGGITYGEDLIHKKYFRIQVRGDGKRQAHIHAAGISLDRCIQKFLHSGKCGNVRETGADFPAGHSQDGAIQVDILAPAEFRVKPRAHFQKAGNTSADADFPFRGIGDLTEDLEEGGFAGAVAPDHADHLASLYFKRDLLQGPEISRSGRGRPVDSRPQGITKRVVTQVLTKLIALADSAGCDDGVHVR